MESMRSPDVRVQMYRERANAAFESLVQAVRGVPADRVAAWPLLPQGLAPSAEMTVLEMVQHLAATKYVTGSTAFHDGDVRWRDMADRIEAVERSASDSIALLFQAQDYWIASWSGIQDRDLGQERATVWGHRISLERLLIAMEHHDVFHTGQIALLTELAVDRSRPARSAAAWIRQTMASAPSY